MAIRPPEPSDTPSVTDDPSVAGRTIIAVVCPACQSNKTENVQRFNIDEAAQHFVLREEYPRQHLALRDRIRDLWRGEICDIVECRDCGFGFASPFVAGDAEFYHLAYPTVGYPTTRWEFARTIKALKQYDISGARAIEIGAGQGFFLDQVVPTFLDRDRVVAVEYNTDSCRHLVRKGYRAYSQDIRDRSFDAEAGAFDLVFMFQVLEHMDAVGAVFERLRFLTSGDAHIFIAVPNAASISFNERTESLRDMPPNHIGRWSRSAFDAIAKRFGFRVVETEFEPLAVPRFLKQDLIYSFLRNAQRSGTLANRVRSMRRGPVRKALEAVIVAAGAPQRIGAWRQKLSQSAVGESLWVHLAR